ncbi:hypothetical protein ABT169_35630, partial [Streptomyces sp. NPDC001616]
HYTGGAVVAVVTSVAFSARQVRVARHANHISVMVDLLQEFRSADFHEQHDYLCTRLGAEHDPAGGVRGLPAEAKTAFYSVVYYYQSFANLAVFGLLDETLRSCCLFDLERWRSNAGSRSGDPALARA